MSPPARSWVETPLEVGDGVDLLPEPARALRRQQVARHRADIVVLIELGPQLDAAAVIQPGHQLAGVGAERDGGEELHGRDLAGPIARGGPAGVDRARGDRVEDFQGRHQGAGLEEFQHHVAVRQDPNPLLHEMALVAELGQLAGKAAGHLPANRLADALALSGR
jgi:hypothetical protein